MNGMFLTRLLHNICRICTFCVFLFILDGLCVQTSNAATVFRLLVFTSPDCAHCTSVKEENLKAIAAKVGCQLEYRFFDIRDMANYQKLVELEDRYHKTDNEMPVVFIGHDVLGGAEEIEKRLPVLLTQYTTAGGSSWPDDTVTQQKPVDNNMKTTAPTDAQTPTKTETQPHLTVSAKPEKQIAHSHAQLIHHEQAIKPKRLPPVALMKLTTKKPQAQVPVDGYTTPVTQVFHPRMPGAASGHPLYLAFFNKYGCKVCERVTYLMSYLKIKYPSLTIREFSLADDNNSVLYEALARKYHIPENKRLIPATLIIGQDYLQQQQITLTRVEALIEKYRAQGTATPWEAVSSAELTAARAGILQRFNTLSIITVACAGLLDGVNPCAFSTLIFLVTYLLYLKKGRKEIMLVGWAFTVGNFMAYFLMGLGTYHLIGVLSRNHILSMVVNLLISLSVILFGILSFGDYMKARKARFADASLQLPRILKQRVHHIIRENYSASYHASAAFAAGFLIALMQVVCTGQVYLPTITFILHQTSQHGVGLLYLLLFNIMCIVPLVAVFTFAYFGATSQQLTQLTKRYNAPVKLGTAFLFTGLGIYLITSVVVNIR